MSGKVTADCSKVNTKCCYMTKHQHEKNQGKQAIRLFAYRLLFQDCMVKGNDTVGLNRSETTFLPLRDRPCTKSRRRNRLRQYKLFCKIPELKFQQNIRCMESPLRLITRRGGGERGGYNSKNSLLQR